MNQWWRQPVTIGIPNVDREWNESNKEEKEEQRKRNDGKGKKEMKDLRLIKSTL